MPEKPEYLSIPLAEAEVRAEDGEQPKLVGYASRYGNWYPVGDFLERIKAGAFDEVLADEETDVVASMNHDVNFAFARQSAGTLRLTSNTVGLQYEADVTDSDGRRVYEKVRGGTIKGSSFMFSNVEDTWEFKDDDPPRRTITKIGRLYELGPVVWPANTAATVKARAEEILAEARQRHAATEEPEPPADAPAAEPEEQDAESTARQARIERTWRAMQRIAARNETALQRIRQAEA